MKFNKTSVLSLGSLFGKTAGITLAALAATATAQADVIYSPNVNIAVPATMNGIYLDVTTGMFSSDLSEVPNYDVHLFDFTALGAGANLRFSPNTGGGYVGAQFNNPLNLSAGYEVGPVLANGFGYYPGSSLTAAYHQDGTEILGFKFLDPNTGNTDYGWATITTTAPTGFPAIIDSYLYDNSGASVFAGVVPEPNSLAACGALALGAAGLISWRRTRRSVA